MANGKKLDVKSIVILALLAVTLVLCIVGMCITWIKTSVTGWGVTMTEESTLAELAKLNKEVQDGKFSAMYAFAIITVIVCGINAVVYAVSKFVSMPVLKKVGVVASGLLVIFAILTIILSYVYIGDTEGAKVSLVGGWMVGICAIVNAVAGAYAAIKA